MLHQLCRVEEPIGLRGCAETVTHRAPRLHSFAPHIAIIGFGKFCRLGVAKWFVTLRFDTNQVFRCFDSCIKPRMTPPAPGKAHLSFDIDPRRRPVEFDQWWERRQIFRPLEKPAESVHSECGAALRTGELARSDFVATSTIENFSHRGFRHTGKQAIGEIVDQLPDSSLTPASPTIAASATAASATSLPTSLS